MIRVVSRIRKFRRVLHSQCSANPVQVGNYRTKCLDPGARRLRSGTAAKDDCGWIDGIDHVLQVVHSGSRDRIESQSDQQRARPVHGYRLHQARGWNVAAEVGDADGYCRHSELSQPPSTYRTWPVM